MGFDGDLRGIYCTIYIWQKVVIVSGSHVGTHEINPPFWMVCTTHLSDYMTDGLKHWVYKNSRNQ